MIRTAMRSLAALALLAVIAGCDKPQPPTSSPPAPQAQTDAADIIYVGDIVTIDDKHPGAESLAVKGGKILAVGTRADVEKAHKGSTTQVVDLGGKTLMPSFIDAHSHYFNALSVASQAKLYPPPADWGLSEGNFVMKALILGALAGGAAYVLGVIVARRVYMAMISMGFDRGFQDPAVSLWMVMLGVQGLPYLATMVTARISARSNRTSGELPAQDAKLPQAA